MSTVSVHKAAWLTANNNRWPMMMDYIFYMLLMKHGLGDDAEKYLAALDPIKPTDIHFLDNGYSNVVSWNLLTTADEYYPAMGIDAWHGQWHGLTSINYFTRIKKDMRDIAKVSQIEPFSLVMLNGRIDAYLKSKYPDYVSTRTI